MSISAPFIARPIATWLLALAILLSGGLGYHWLPVSALPEVDFPTIQVVTQLPGAGPETVETLITASLERQFGQIPGLVTMTSQSAEGTSQITLQFQLGRSMDSAAQDVQAAINGAAGTLPASLPYPPTYSKVNPADAPILTMALTSDTRPVDVVSDAADTMLQPKLAEIDGVGRVTVQGTMRPAVRIQVDPARLAGYGLAMEDVRTAITNANVNGAKGGFDGPRLAFSLGANDQLGDAAAYKDLVIAWRDNAPVRLSDLGRVVAGVENARVAATYDGKPAVVLDIQRQPGANIVRTVEAVKQELPRLRRAMPSGIRLTIVSDRTETIRASVADVQFTLLLSVVLVVGVIFVFLRSVRATIIPAIALPLSLIGTFGVMDLLGFGLDNLSLMALTVATGFVVDDAIVMIENVVRYIEQGMRPLQAAFRGASQIGFTIVSLTVSLIAVFIPLLFMTGVVGRLFNEFAVTLSVSVIVSAVISLTLTPMMCGRLLRPAAEEHPTGFARWTERGFLRLLAGYRHSLDWSFRHQGFVLLVGLATLIGTTWLYIIIPKGFLPRQDTGVLVAVTEAGAKHLDPETRPAANRDGAYRAAGSRRDRRGLVRGRRHDQRHAEYRAADDRVEAARSTRSRRRGDRPLAPRGGGHSWAGGVHSAGAGHSDRLPPEPHAIPVHTDGYRRGCARAVGAQVEGEAGEFAANAGCGVGSAGRRLPHQHRGRSRRGDAAGRADAGGRGHAV